MRQPAPLRVVLGRAVRLLPVLVLMAACGGAAGDGAPPSTPPPVEVPPPTVPDEPACEPFESTFAAIEAKIFAQHGCTASACHGDARSGELDLRPGSAYGSLVDVPARSSSQKRIDPGAPASSFLFNKLRAATEPGSVTVGGSPMPVGAAPLSANELEAVRVWIAAGAPESGSVGDPRFERGSADYVSDLLGVCLPESEIVEIRPLEAPARDEGIQFVMPPYTLAANSEWEGCFASYYDFRDRVPDRFRSADGESFFVNGTVIRQDAASHHLVILQPGLGLEVADHPSLGGWACRTGPRRGEACDPADLAACGAGHSCATVPQAGVACIGFGPPGAEIDPTGFGLGTALQSQVRVDPVPGSYRQIPIRGLVYWNLHGFNLTNREADLHARMNLLFTDDLRYEETHTSVGGPIPPVPPFTELDTCGTFTLPQGSTLLRLSSHTHRHGQHFRVDDSAGERVYESFFYSDPAYLVFDPPRVFDSPDEAERTLRFCVTFNNGVAEDGSPDLDLVTRRSRTPPTSWNPCTPVACTAGRVGEACRGVSDHAACDSSPGAGDGECDACVIRGGVTTEDEMFFLLPDYWLPSNSTRVRASVTP